MKSIKSKRLSITRKQKIDSVIECVGKDIYYLFQLELSIFFREILNYCEVKRNKSKLKKNFVIVKHFI